MAILVQTPVPELGAGLGELPRFRAELGPFVGLSAAIRVGALTQGFGTTQNDASALGGLEAAFHVGVGLEGVLDESNGALAFAQVGVREHTHTTGAATLPSQRSLHKMATTTANGGIIPWQDAVALNSFQMDLLIFEYRIFRLSCTEEPLYSPQIALPLLLVIVSPSVFADQVAFKNGDRLTGAILKSDAKSLLMTTAVAGEVTVSWQEIQELRSDLPLHVVLANGKELVGRMTTSEGKVKIVTDTGVTVEASKESVAALRNNAEQLAYEKSQHGSLLHGWDGGLDAGFELSRGTSKTRNFRFAFGAVRKVSRKELTLYAESLYSIDDVAGTRPHVTANVNKGGARFDHDFVSRLFLFANTDFMSDGLQDLNLRSVLGGGIGYHLINRDNATLNLLGGANFTRENYVEVQRNLAAAQVGEEFTLKLGKGTALLQNLAFFPDLTNSGGNYRTNFSLRTVTKIGKWLGWQNNFSDTYVTNPPVGKQKNELVFTSGLHLAFSH